jgi:hypothetical protein
MSRIVRLIVFIDRFLAGEDGSLLLVRQIEGVLLENFTQEAWFDGASVVLAQYSPAGAKNMVDVPALAEVLRGVRADLDGDTKD